MFKTDGPLLMANGFSPVPIDPNSKRPSLREWQNPLSEADVAQMAANGKAECYTGFLTVDHPTADGDCQSEEASKAAREIIKAVAGPTVLRVGKAPKFALIYRLPDGADPYPKLSSAKWIDPLEPDPTKTNQVEILADGQQLVLSGIHPETQQPYKTNRPLSDIVSSTLPTLSQQQAIRIINQFDAWCDENGYLKVSQPYQNTPEHPKTPITDLDTVRPPLTLTTREIKHHLSEVNPASCDYDAWLTVGMALHHQFNGHPDGLTLWQRWACDGGHNPKYTNGRYTDETYAYKYNSFNDVSNRRPTTFATVVRWAADSVYPPRRTSKQQNAPEAPISRSEGVSHPLIARFNRMAITEEIINSIQDAEYAYPDLIIKGQLTIFVAMPGAGKSALLRHLSGYFAQSGGLDVMYFDLDSPATMIGRNATHAQEHQYHYFAPHMFAGESAQSVLNDIAQSVDAGEDMSSLVLIFDTVKKFTDMMNKGKLKQFFDLLRELTARGATVILLGHANKYRDRDGNLVYEGTGDVLSDVDCLTYLEYQKDTDKQRQVISTYPEKTRGVIEPLTFELDLSNWDIHQVDGYVDVKTEIHNVFEATQKLNRFDPDKTVRIAVNDAMCDGFTSQVEIVEYCASKGFGRNKVLRVLKLASQEGGPVQWLEKIHHPMEKNRVEYRKVTREGDL